MAAVEVDREKVLQDYRKKLMEHKEVESRLKESKWFFAFLHITDCLPLICLLI